ncbi:hypothetical protein J1614_010643 [Plenodomus biglobosus]|nr:hypothetical protein J1614_010643 [Plenodomus biglobosus]
MLFISIILASATLTSTYALPSYRIPDSDSPSTLNTTSKRGLPPSRSFPANDPIFYPTPPQPTGPTSALSISYDHDDRKLKAETLDWVFMYTPYGKDVGCKQDFACKIRRDPWSAADDFAPVPGGTWHLDLNGEKCTYRNSGDNFGKLYCGGHEFACFDDPAGAAVDKGEYKCDGKDGPLTVLAYAGITRRPRITCPYRSAVWG